MNMSRGAWLNVLLIIVAALLAIGLFVAGAMWKGRVSREQRLTSTELFPVRPSISALINNT